MPSLRKPARKPAMLAPRPYEPRVLYWLAVCKPKASQVWTPAYRADGLVVLGLTAEHAVQGGLACLPLQKGRDWHSMPDEWEVRAARVVLEDK